MNNRSITAHVRVRNEEHFVKQAIESVLPAVDKVLVFDTGSTDRTLDKIRQINDPRIEIVHKPPTDAAGLSNYRNEMADRSATEWYWIVDGDEVYPQGVALRLREFLETVPDHIHRISVHRKHFYGSFNLISKPDALGRIYRVSRIRMKLFDPKYRNEVGHETPYDTANPKATREEMSMTVPKEIYFFHMHYMPRSPKDRELGRMRSWRNPPVPLNLYLGPWPEGLANTAPEKRLTLRLVVYWLQTNGRCAWKWLRFLSGKALSKLPDALRICKRSVCCCGHSKHDNCGICYDPECPCENYRPASEDVAAEPKDKPCNLKTA